MGLFVVVVIFFYFTLQLGNRMHNGKCLERVPSGIFSPLLAAAIFIINFEGEMFNTHTLNP